MKLYKNLVDAIALTVQDIFKGQRYADKAIERVFKQHPQWGSRDRRFVAEGVYEIVRNYRLYARLAETETNYWFITAVWLVLRGTEIPEWQEFKHVRPDQIKAARELLREDFNVNESVPDWLYERISEEIGEDAARREIQAMNTPANVYLRVNTLKTTIQACKTELEKDGVQTILVPDLENALQLQKRENIFSNRLFKEGWFEIQDAGSQQIASFLMPRSGETVIDACAGAGGKSLHLAALMNNKGRIISMDVEDYKLEELKKRARRANAHNIETKIIDKTKTIQALQSRADRVLLDVPCSGLGVLKRNPDAKWKLDKEKIEKTSRIQRVILQDYSAMVKAGGTVVYSTCSILPSENEKVVQAFLEKNKNYALKEEKHLSPSQGFDGFYMARIERLT